MKKIALFTLLILTVLMISSCGLFSPGPGKVVEKFYRYVEKGELESAKNLFAKQIQEAMGGKLMAGLSEETNHIKDKGGVKDIEIINEEITGESARVTARVSYGNGSDKSDNTKLIKENGAWKITISK